MLTKIQEAVFQEQSLVCSFTFQRSAQISPAPLDKGGEVVIIYFCGEFHRLIWAFSSAGRALA